MPSDYVEGDTDSSYTKTVRAKVDEVTDRSRIDLTDHTVLLRWRYTEDGPMTKSAVMTNSNQTTNRGEATRRWLATELVSPFLIEDVVVTNTSTGRFVTQLDEVKLIIRKKAAGP